MRLVDLNYKIVSNQHKSKYEFEFVAWVNFFFRFFKTKKNLDIVIRCFFLKNFVKCFIHEVIEVEPANAPLRH